jgi:hypothetical protein
VNGCRISNERRWLRSLNLELHGWLLTKSLKYNAYGAPAASLGGKVGVSQAANGSVAGQCTKAGETSAEDDVHTVFEEQPMM